MGSKDNHSRDISAGRDDTGSAGSREDDDYGNNCRLIKNEVDIRGDNELIAMDMIAIKNISGAISSDIVVDNRSGGNAEQDINGAAVGIKVKKSSDRNAINFMVLGYVILVIILTYCYFGTLISDYLPNGQKDFKFVKTITSTELIVILWFTIIYGTCLLLFLRFKVLRLERDPNSDKHKKKRKSEDFTAFLNSNRNKKSFKNLNLSHVIVDGNNGNNGDSNPNKNTPFWTK